MKFNLLHLGVVLAVLLGSASLAVAQNDDAAAAPKARHFGLYVEAFTGGAGSEQFPTSIQTVSSVSQNLAELDDMLLGTAAVGWELPDDKGMFKLKFTGFKEESYRFSASGQTPLLQNDQGTILSNPNTPLVEWWALDVSNGQLVAQAQLPTWDSADDANGDNIPDQNEIRFLPSTVGGSRLVSDDLQNRLQTVDLLFERDFGGRVVNARWGAGARYFVYEGNVPVAAWLRPDVVTNAQGYQGYTEGSNLALLSFSQDTTGFGPTGFAELHVNFARERVVLYGLLRASFILQDMSTDSGEFFTLVRDSATGTIRPAPARVSNDLSKDVWQTGAEVGVRVRLVSGLVLHLGYYLSSYQDSLLLASEFLIPSQLSQIPFGTTALFATRDIELDGWQGGFSFQF